MLLNYVEIYEREQVQEMNVSAIGAVMAASSVGWRIGVEGD